MNDQIEIGKHKLPLSSYDLIGYLIPGGTVLALITLFEYWLRVMQKQELTTPFWSLLQNTWPQLAGKDVNWVLAAAYLLSLLSAAYAAGHVVSSLSSLAIDRVLIAKGYVYPVLILLALERSPTWEEKMSRGFYRGLVFWLNVPLLLLVAHTYSSRHSMFLYGAGLLLFGLLFVVVPLKVALSASRPRRLQRWLSGRSRSKRGVLLARNFFAIAFPAPYDLAARTLGVLLNTRAAFPDSIVKVYRAAFWNQFGLDSSKCGTWNFWLCYCHVVETSPTLGALLSNWLRLYSFARNLSTSFYLGFLYCIATYTIQHGRLAPSSVGPLWLPPAAFFLVSLVMLVRYYYLYVAYYSKFVIRAYIYLRASAPASEMPPGLAPGSTGVATLAG